MKHLSKITLFTVVLLSSGPIGAHNIATKAVEDTVNTTTYYAEHTVRLAIIKYLGDAFRKGVPLTKNADGLFKLIEKLPFSC